METQSEKVMSHRMAFNTANFVARQTGWRFELKNWGEQDRITRERTDEREFAAICRDVAGVGYTAVEIWVAHVEPAKMTDKRAELYRRILADHGLAPIGLGGGLDEGSNRVCLQLGIPAANGGLWGTDAATINRLTPGGVRYNYENHPEKSVDEIREKIAGIDGAGIAVDTGWLGSQGLDAAATITALG